MDDEVPRASGGRSEMLRLIQKWLKAGVSENGQWSETNLGTPQGAVVSPLLANVYLHYVFDLWADVWREKVAMGDIVVVRWLPPAQIRTSASAHTALTKDEWRRSVRRDRDAGHGVGEPISVQQWGKSFPTVPVLADCAGSEHSPQPVDTSLEETQLSRVAGHAVVLVITQHLVSVRVRPRPPSTFFPPKSMQGFARMHQSGRG
jgi:hypothetical protein